MATELETRPQVQPPAPPAPPRRRPGWPAALALLVAIGGAIGFVVAYAVDASTAWLGSTMALVFLGLGVALAYWGRDLSDDDRPEVDRYPIPPEVQVAEREQLAADLHGDVEVITRRRFLTTLLVGAAGIAGLSQVALLFSLGPKSRGLGSTSWRPGRRLVTVDGLPVSRARLTPGSFVVAFPEGHLEAADSQIVVFRLPTVKPLAGRESWSPDGFYAYSRVCTHAGCSVAQYEDESLVLYCPCHQSTFDLTQGCRPAAGPAARPLPQLPLALDGADGLVAQRDFLEPVGPGYWNMYA
ncbi:MAG TPA: Rieske 2Fe-2S domain-containing protein [Thermoleophilia bacterium]|nr:Rieske 2Fe-2S domain-containing protein [Thermoleophilia bacterium]